LIEDDFQDAALINSLEQLMHGWCVQ